MGFLSYQGFQLTQLKTAGGGNIDASVDSPGGVTISFRFFVDAAWATDGGQRQASGIWPFITTTDPRPQGFFFVPVGEYIDKDVQPSSPSAGRVKTGLPFLGRSCG